MSLTTTRGAVQDDIVVAVRYGKVICDIGQVEPATRRKLDRMAKAGELAKWRGHWYPQAGAPWGIGPLKTCWGLPEIGAAFGVEPFATDVPAALWKAVEDFAPPMCGECHSAASLDEDGFYCSYCPDVEDIAHSDVFEHTLGRYRRAAGLPPLRRGA